MNMPKYWTRKSSPILIAIPVKCKTTPFHWVSKPTISPTTTPIMATPDGETTLPALPSMYMTTIGDGVAFTAGTTLIGILAGAILTTAGDGAGTDLGDLTVGAGADTTVGAVTHTMVAGDMQATMVVGVDTTTMAGDPITTTTITVEIMPITVLEEGTIPFPEQLLEEVPIWPPGPEQADTPQDTGRTVDAPI